MAAVEEVGGAALGDEERRDVRGGPDISDRSAEKEEGLE